jgi:hypothetical protein
MIYEKSKAQGAKGKRVCARCTAFWNLHSAFVLGLGHRILNTSYLRNSVQ